MKRYYWLALIFAAYLGAGFFVVPANEKAVVRRFGQAVWPLRSSGLNYDLPWPFSRVDRVNFHEVRNLSLGDIEVDPGFLKETSSNRPLMFLTGDKNLLLMRISVQYRISQDRVADWLYGSHQPEQRLRLLVESVAADLVVRSGVDFVHTLGLSELNARLFSDIREQVELYRLGCEIEQVTIDRAEPPARVKADFLDVSNARAEMAQTIHEAKSYAEQALAESHADARKVTDAALREQRSMVAAARGSADRFLLFIEQILRDATENGRAYATSRQLVMRRMTIETIKSVLQKSKLKIVLGGDQQIDLTFPKEAQ